MNRIVNRARTEFTRHPDLSTQTVLFAAAFALYWRTMPPTVLDGDSGEFQYMASILGVSHSSGYPLYILLGKLFTFLPLGDVAYRVNLLSVVCAALAVPLVYAVARRVIGARVPAALATLIFALIPSMWGGALETKPYSLHLLLGVLALLLALRWHAAGMPRDFYALALVFGLGLANHHVILFTAPAFALVVWLNRARLNRKMFALGALLALGPLLLYGYLPLRANYFIAQQNPDNLKLYGREDAILKGTVTAYWINTPQAFLGFVTGLDNSYKLGFTSDTEQASRTDVAGSLLLQQFGALGLALAALGAVISFQRDRKLFAVLAAYGGGVAFIAFYLRGISTVYYFSLAYFILAVWISCGLDALMQWSRRAYRGAPAVIALAALALPVSALAANYVRLDESNNYQARDDARAVLNDHLAPNSVVLAPWEVSQPLRYFQFVENVRPDLLVINVSPIYQRQFETLLKNAHGLQRPFYWVQFEPESKTPGVPRSVQAVPLPLMQEPQPRYRLPDARLVDQVQVLGYDLEPDPPMPGKPARVLVYYRAPARIYPMYAATFRVTDVQGRLWKETSGFPGTFYFPTYRWYELGEFYRDAWALDLPADAPGGLYNLDLSWAQYDLAVGNSDAAPEHKVALGTIRVGDFIGGSIAHAASARVGDAITFLGWSGDASAAARGQPLSLDLFWRADHVLPDSYTVFVHLVDATGRVVADSDSPPSQGLYPTNRWNADETVRDHHRLQVPADLPPGNYAIEIGMYLSSSGARLPIGAADKIVLTQVSVK